METDGQPKWTDFPQCLHLFLPQMRAFLHYELMHILAIISPDRQLISGSYLMNDGF